MQSYELGYGLYIVWILLPTGFVVMWMLSGGFTILRHYAIRWLLARHQTFPWRTQAFLDDATTRILLRRVGGGYSFIHRRLQDYFADAVVSPPQEHEQQKTAKREERLIWLSPEHSSPDPSEK